jgi:hypothetical protein
MKTILKDCVGILFAFLVFWLVGVLILPVVGMIWPVNPSDSLSGLKPQHFPALSVAFVFALYTFRRFTAVRPSKAAS